MEEGEINGHEGERETTATTIKESWRVTGVTNAEGRRLPMDERERTAVSRRSEK